MDKDKEKELKKAFKESGAFGLARYLHNEVEEPFYMSLDGVNAEDKAKNLIKKWGLERANGIVISKESMLVAANAVLDAAKNLLASKEGLISIAMQDIEIAESLLEGDEDIINVSDQITDIMSSLL